jgi:hypothetical protein
VRVVVRHLRVRIESNSQISKQTLGGCMISNLRACLANIVARLHGGRVNGAVYDHSQGKHIHVSGTLNGQAVSVYDHD